MHEDEEYVRTYKIYPIEHIIIGEVKLLPAIHVFARSGLFY